MSVVFAEGFDWCGAGAQLTGRGTLGVPSSSGSVGLNTGALGTGRCLSLDPGTFASGGASLAMDFASDITTGRVVIHMRMRFRNSFHDSSTIHDFIRIRNTAAASVCSLSYNNSSQTLYVRRGTTTLFTIAGALVLGTWRHWVFDFVIHASDGSVTILQDGETLLHETGVNTQGASGDLRSILLNTAGQTGSMVVDFDDVVIDDTEQLGQLVVTYHPVDSDVGTPDWTPSAGSSVAAVIDEAPANADTDYASSSVTDDVTRHGITPGLAGQRIFSVQPIVVARVEDSAVSQVATVLHSASADDGGVTSPALTTAYRGFAGALTVADPNTLAEWLPGGLDAAELEITHIVTP